MRSIDSGSHEPWSNSYQVDGTQVVRAEPQTRSFGHTSKTDLADLPGLARIGDM